MICPQTDQATQPPTLSHTPLSLSLSLSLSHTHTHTEIMRETRLLNHLDHPNIVIFLARSRTHTPCFICLRKSCVSFAEYRLFYRALLQKRLIILWSLLVRETRRDGILQKSRMITHAPCFICLRMFRGKDGRDWSTQPPSLCLTHRSQSLSLSHTQTHMQI